MIPADFKFAGIFFAYMFLFVLIKYQSLSTINRIKFIAK